MAIVPSQNQYVVLLEKILESDTNSVEIKVYTHTQLSGIRAGLSRAKKSYSQVKRFLSDTDHCKGKQFQYEQNPKDDFLWKISLVPKKEVKFKIVDK